VKFQSLRLMSRLLLSVVATLTATHFAWGQAMPVVPSSIQRVDATLDTVPAKGFSMGNFFVEFEKKTLDEIAGKLLHSTLQHRGDAGDSVYWLCYTIQRVGTSQRIWIISDGEMGGAEHSITGIHASNNRAGAAPTTDCPALPIKFLPVTLDNHLWLGSSLTDIRKALGAAPDATKGWWSFRYDGKTGEVVNSKSVTYDLTSSLEIKLSRGLVTAISVHQIISN
jgi:hypothetical protein